MIKPIRIESNTYMGNNYEYNDPLLNWPLRGAAFTNEIGEAMRPLIGNYATISWAPALLYIGADVYDKYKNDKTEYSPSSRRALKQAIFQGLASICLPIVSVKLGQNIFSLIGLCTKDKIRFNTKEHVNKLADEFISNGKMHVASNNNQCVDEFLSIVSNNMDLSEKLQVKHAYHSNKNNIKKYAEKTIKELIQIREILLNPDDEAKISELYLSYELLLKNGKTQNVAIKNILQRELKKKTLKGNFIKTIGGFIALGLSIKPIDNFVENVLIGKVVTPTLDKKKDT